MRSLCAVNFYKVAFPLALQASPTITRQLYVSSAQKAHAYTGRTAHPNREIIHALEKSTATGTVFCHPYPTR